MSQKKYDSDIVGWYTRGGKRVPIRKGENTARKGAKTNAKKGAEAKDRAPQSTKGGNREDYSPRKRKSAPRKNKPTGQEETKNKFARIREENEAKRKEIERDYEKIPFREPINEGDEIYIMSGGDRRMGTDPLRFEKAKSAGGSRFYSGDGHILEHNGNVWRKKERKEVIPKRHEKGMTTEEIVERRAERRAEYKERQKKNDRNDKRRHKKEGDREREALRKKLEEINKK